MDDCTYPVSITDFRWKILLPEVAAKLIMHDSYVDHYTAVKIMRRSGRYGMAAFPHEDEDIYDQMIAEMLSPPDCDGPSNLSPDVLNTLNETSSTLLEDKSSSLSGGALVDNIWPAPSANADVLVPIPVQSNVASDVGSSQLGPGDSISDISTVPRQWFRRRKLPRSMIPSILTESEEEGSAGEQDTGAWKKFRLV